MRPRWPVCLVLVAAASFGCKQRHLAGASVLNEAGGTSVGCSVDHGLVANDSKFAYECVSLFDSIDNLISSLPETFRSRYVLVHKSRSIQSASPAAPRVLMFSKDAKLVLAFNGDASQAGYKRLEIMQFDDKNSSFAFNEIREEKGKLTVEKSPAVCTGCHGNDARPVWDAYRFWPGTYGAFDGYNYEYFKNSVLKNFPGYTQETYKPAVERELTELKSFIKAVENKTAPLRYQMLVRLKDRFDAEIGRDSRGTDNPYFETIVPPILSKVPTKTSPNSELTLLLSDLNWQRIGRKIINTTDYSAFRFAAQAAFASKCKDLPSFLPQRVRSAYDQNSMSEQDLMKDSNRYLRNAYLDRPVFKIRYLFEGRGIDMSDWFMQLKSSYSANSGFPLLIDDGVFLSRVDTTLPQGYPSCEDLKAKSLAALADLAPEPYAATYGKKLHDTDSTVVRGVIDSCSTCHGDKRRYIPFDDYTKLGNALVETDSSGASLFDRIRERLVASDAGRRMPLGEDELTAVQRENFESWLKGAIQQRAENTDIIN